jgi:hypothetical protein
VYLNRQQAILSIYATNKNGQFSSGYKKNNTAIVFQLKKSAN